MVAVLLRTFIGVLCPLTYTCTFIFCPFIGSVNPWTFFFPTFGYCQRQPSYEDHLLVYWPCTLCRALLLNFWTFLWTYTWPGKRNIQLTKDLKLLIGQHSQRGPCGNHDKLVEDGSKRPTSRTDSRHKLFFNMCYELYMDVPEYKSRLEATVYLLQVDNTAFVWRFSIK